MGYWEVPCQLCGVSFNIGRYRTRYEPRTAAWGTMRHGGARLDWLPGRWRPLTGTGCGPTCQGDNECQCDGTCPCEGGCDERVAVDPCEETCAAVHHGTREHIQSLRDGDGSLWPDDPMGSIDQEDPTYESESESDGEPLEYNSDESMRDPDEGVGEQNVVYDGHDNTDRVLGPMPTTSGTTSGKGTLWTFRVNGLPVRPWEQQVDSTFLAVNNTWHEAGHGRDYAGKMRHLEFEHIAGPQCSLDEGYNGFYISAEEMQDCRTVQFLVRKTPGWQPQHDDMDFELDSAYHLTGLANFMVSSEYENKLSPIRHGVRYACAANDDSYSREIQYETWLRKAIPFHPACFHIFTVVCRAVFGTVDIDGLANLRNCLYDEFVPKAQSRFPERSEDVRAGAQQSWICYRGSEYLAANPVFIPKFHAICTAAVSSDANFNASRSPFADRSHVQPLDSEVRDPFCRFPVELKMQIIKCLSSRDFAALRLASRAFTHVPTTVWHDLLVREMPFVYEAWSDDSVPYRWAFLDATALLDDVDAIAKHLHEWYEFSEAIRPIDPALHSYWSEKNPRLPQAAIDKLDQDVRRPSKHKLGMLSHIRKLPLSTTNWYQLYRDLRANWHDLKGLQNRKRIFEDIECIVDNIKAGREAAPDARSDFFTMEDSKFICGSGNDEYSFVCSEEKSLLYSVAASESAVGSAILYSNN